jgi:hypothetical protein
MTAAPDSLQQRYEAIERVYSERQWDVVARRSEELLLDLPNDPGHPLRQRLQLLLGHTFLYGYQDGATAAGFYSRVQAATKEPVLLEIATQGLEQCESQAPAPTTPAATTATTAVASDGQTFPFTAEAVHPTPTGSGAMPAMPWMEHLGSLHSVPHLMVEVIDEPELIEVAQANPATAQDLEVAVSAESPTANAERPAQSINSLSPEEIAELSKGLLRVVIR